MQCYKFQLYAIYIVSELVVDDFEAASLYLIIRIAFRASLICISMQFAPQLDVICRPTIIFMSVYNYWFHCLTLILW